MVFDGRLISGAGVLAAVVQGGSFANAADALGLSASGVSRAIAGPGRARRCAVA
jgi:hypothetical protein